MSMFIVLAADDPFSVASPLLQTQSFLSLTFPKVDYRIIDKKSLIAKKI